LAYLFPLWQKCFEGGTQNNMEEILFRVVHRLQHFVLMKSDYASGSMKKKGRGNERWRQMEE